LFLAVDKKEKHRPLRGNTAFLLLSALSGQKFILDGVFHPVQAPVCSPPDMKKTAEKKRRY